MSDTNVTVEFELLDVAPQVGDVKSTTPEVPLFVAVASINDTIAAGQFVVRLIGDEVRRKSHDEVFCQCFLVVYMRSYPCVSPRGF